MVTTSYQYPQYLYALQHNGESVQLPNGSWETPAAVWELKATCREETNGKGSTIQTADGKTRVFASLIQLPKGTAKIPEGTQGGKTFRLRGKGIVNMRTRDPGDLFLHISIETPVNLTSKQKQLLRDFEASLKDGGNKHNPKTQSFFDRMKSFFG